MFGANFIFHGLQSFCCSSPPSLAIAQVDPTKSNDPQPVQSLVQLTAEEQAYVQQNPIITMAISEAFPPRSFPDSQGTLQGINIDILNLIEERLNVDFQLIPSLWKDAPNRVKIKPMP